MKKITVLVLESNKGPYVKEITNFLESYHEIVGGDMLDYSWLCSCLREAYGTDFRKDRDSVNVLYRGMLTRQGWQNGIVYSPYEIFCVNLYPEIMPFLLEGDIDKKIFKQAKACYEDERSRKIYLKNPAERWIYMALEEWGEDPSREYRKGAKTLAFTMRICG